MHASYLLFNKGTDYKESNTSYKVRHFVRINNPIPLTYSFNKWHIIYVIHNHLFKSFLKDTCIIHSIRRYIHYISYTAAKISFKEHINFKSFIIHPFLFDPILNTITEKPRVQFHSEWSGVIRRPVVVVYIII